MKLKNKILLFVAVAFLAGTQACVGPFFNDTACITGRGEIVTDTAEIATFNSIVNETVVDLEIMQGNSQLVIVEGHENMIDELELKVSKGELTVDLVKGCYNNVKLKVYITIPNLEAVTVESTGDVKMGGFNNLQSLYIGVKSTGDLKCEGTLIVDKTLEIESESTGSILLNTLTDEVLTYMSGTGNVTIGGSCNSQTVELSSTGSYRGFDLDSETCEVRNSGVGDAKVYVTDQLDVRISSVGSVYYMGDPTVSVTDTGVGDLVHIE